MKYLTNREAVQALLDGKKLLYRGLPVTVPSIDFVLLDKPSHYNLAPETVTREITYPKPESAPLKMGQRFFTPSLLTIDEVISCHTWEGDDYDTQWLSRGLIHLTEEDAIAHSKAMIGGEG